MIRSKLFEHMEKSGVAFGTSGARGLVLDFSDELLCALALSFVQHMSKKWSFETVVIAGDLRPSTPHFVRVLTYALKQKGYQVIYGGEVPSPALALFGFTHRYPSIMVTGSHIPDDRNGIKFNTPVGEITKEDEKGMLNECPELDESWFDGDKKLKATLAEPEVESAVEENYLKRYVEALPENVFKGMRVGFYQHSSVGRKVIPRIFESLGAEVLLLGYSEVFVPVDTEAIRPEDQALALEFAQEHDFDLLFSTDGDADRPIVADEKGRWMRGDVLGVMTADVFEFSALATPVSCNSLVERCQKFARVERTKIGSPFVLAAMERLAEEFESVAGYEANGGFLTQTSLKMTRGTLAPLPTRDAVLPMIGILLHLHKERTTLSQLLSELPAVYTASDRIKETPTEKSKELILRLVESPEEGLVKLSELERLAGAKLQNKDLTDGMRMYFENRTVIHLRPSGNAPELRCYSEADSEERAAELVAQTLSLIQQRFS